MCSLELIAHLVVQAVQMVQAVGNIWQVVGSVMLGGGTSGQVTVGWMDIR